MIAVKINIYKLALSKFIYAFIFILNVDSFNCQNQKIDSLNNEIKTTNNEDYKTKLYYSLAVNYSQFDLSKSDLYCINTVKLASKQKNHYYLVLGINRLARNFHKKSNYKYSIKLCELGLAIAINQKYKKLEASTYNDIGSNYTMLGDHRNALINFHKSLQLSTQIKNDTCLKSALNNIGLSFQENDELDSALIYYKEALFINKKLNDNRASFLVLNNIATIYLKQKKYQESYDIFKSVAKNDSLNGDLSSLIETLHNISCVQIKLGNYSQAKYSIQQVNELADKLDNSEMLIYTYLNLAEINSIEGKNRNAIILLEKALKCAIKNKFTYALSDIYLALSENHKRNRDFEKSLFYHKKHTDISDSLNKNKNVDLLENIKLSQEINNKTILLNLKEKEIQLNVEINKRKNIIIIVSFTFFILMLIIFIFYIKIKKNKLMFTQQKQSLEAFFNGQEAERNRLSQELHDGICQNLTIIKMGLENEIYNDSINKENIKSKTKEIEGCIGDIRDVSHNIAPILLYEMGLKQALNSLVYNINKLNKFKLEIEFDDKIQNISKTIEIHIYRITQELLNNALKHSNSSFVKISFLNIENGLILEYNDNGIGIENLNKKTGTGLKNIKTRVDLINSKIQINDEIKGLNIIIDIKL